MTQRGEKLAEAERAREAARKASAQLTNFAEAAATEGYNLHISKQNSGVIGEVEDSPEAIARAVRTLRELAHTALDTLIDETQAGLIADHAADLAVRDQLSD